MRKNLFPVIAIVLGLQVPARADEQPNAVPAKQLAKYVIEHLDVTSFPSSIGYRWQANKTTFADYGFIAQHVGSDKASLETRDKDWLFEVRVLNHDKNSITVCLHDLAENAGGYDTQSILRLQPAHTGNRLVASGSSWIAAAGN